MELSIEDARGLTLAAQGLHERPAGPARKEDVLAAIRPMGMLQIDTIQVVARSPYLVLWSRLGAYETRWLEELLAEGALFEYWSHAACFLLREDYGLYRSWMLERAEWAADPDRHGPELRDAMERVLARLREHGAVRSADFERTDGKAGKWWNWKPEKHALELLFTAGAVMIARRERFQRVYDLRERVRPDWDDAATPAREDATRSMVLRAVRALGVAQTPWVRNYFPSYLPAAAAQRALQALVADGDLLSADVEGWTAPAYVHRDSLDLGGAPGPRATLTALLSPFDPLVSDRGRAKTMFGFEYRIETYTPAPKRRYGYFTLPILHRGELVGRLDPKAHRRDGVFEVKALHLEPGVEITDTLAAGLAGELRACAAWHGTPEVVVRVSDPPEAAPILRSALERH